MRLRVTPIVLPPSPMAVAIGYMLDRWEALCRYVKKGHLDIDNNTAEGGAEARGGRAEELAVRRHRRGRGQSHARLGTLIASAERHGIDPQRYLASVLAEIGRTPVGEWGEFLPDVRKAETLG